MISDRKAYTKANTEAYTVKIFLDCKLNKTYPLTRAGGKKKIKNYTNTLSMSLVEDCDCRESGQSAVQREAGGHGLRPIHCALIKYNHFNPHNSTVCYQKQLQAWCIPNPPHQPLSQLLRTGDINSDSLSLSRQNIIRHWGLSCWYLHSSNSFFFFFLEIFRKQP